MPTKLWTLIVRLFECFLILTLSSNSMYKMYIFENQIFFQAICFVNACTFLLLLKIASYLPQEF